MGVLKKLFQHTVLYGLATVLPRMLNFLLVPLYTDILPEGEYGQISVIFAYLALFNVVLSYGMETAFFRFLNKQKDKGKVLGTSSASLLLTSGLFLILTFSLRHQIAVWIDIPLRYVQYVIWILVFDALVVVPFAWLRAQERPMRYTAIKVLNVVINLGLNIFFLLFLEDLAAKYSIFEQIYRPHYEIAYVFIANFIASLVTLFIMLPFYKRVKWQFDVDLWKRMLRYASPILIAGMAFTVNEVFDRILLKYLLPPDTAEAQVGIYSACYKLALFMTLFIKAFRLGIEPFFFSHAEEKGAEKTYALITRYFVIFAAFILLLVMVFLDPLKRLIIRDEGYWDAMDIVPIILLANLCLGLYHNLSVWYKITDRTRFAGYISVFGAVVTLGLNFLLIPIIGYRGSAWATLAAYASMMILSYIFGKKYYPVPYNLKAILGYLGLAILLSFVSFFAFRDQYWFGVVSVVAFLILIYSLERHQIKQVISSKSEKSEN